MSSRSNPMHAMFRQVSISEQYMVSQTAPVIKVPEFDSYIWAYHAWLYQENWRPVIGEVLLLKREPDNSVDMSAVGVWREDEIVGDAPYNIAYVVISQFLRKDYKKVFVLVIGGKVNRVWEAGYVWSIELLCIYRFYGPNPYIERITELVHYLQERGLLWLLATDTKINHNIVW